MQLIGFLGVVRDVKKEKPTFRPSIALCMRADVLVDRFYLLHNGKSDALLNEVIADIAQVSPNTEVIPTRLDCSDPYDRISVFSSMLAFVKGLPAGVTYHVNLTTDTQMQKHCCLRLEEARCASFKFIQTYVAKTRALVSGAPSLRGEFRELDFNYAEHDAYHALLQENSANIDKFLKSGIETRNATYNQLITDLERICLKSQSAILIEGPTGSGKSALAQRLYDLKHKNQRITGRFVSVNCATLHPDHAQSMLFGHTKGAFTGALSHRDGLIKEADGGVLFLDEINSLSPDVQGLLLSAMEQKSFYPVGSDKLVFSNFVLFCGANESLHELSAKGLFRDDLLARLDLWHFVLPGLRDRMEDIEPNLEYELAKWQRSAGQFVRFNTESRAEYLAFATHPNSLWSRNFRDLAGSVERMCVMSENGIINQSDVAQEISRLRRSWGVADTTILTTHIHGLNEHGKSELVRLMRGLTVFDAQVLQLTIAYCMRHKTLTSAAKELYASFDGCASELANPTSRLKNYLDRMGVDFKAIQSWHIE